MKTVVAILNLSLCDGAVDPLSRLSGSFGLTDFALEPRCSLALFLPELGDGFGVVRPKQPGRTHVRGAQERRNQKEESG